ncbi:hypothetical protein F8B43_2624 [Methylorubrum populi]|uniref:Uncharacterized protein n=1 Tax=Methylorubrum populi TaxID=223967 RepID=A0A833J782_9HYPH|nr:hypothetical protein F8B43_2624 [Methylorubrum populi]
MRATSSVHGPASRGSRVILRVERLPTGSGEGRPTALTEGKPLMKHLIFPSTRRSMQRRRTACVGPCRTRPAAGTVAEETSGTG